jgi:hypothetical protein
MTEISPKEEMAVIHALSAENAALRRACEDYKFLIGRAIVERNEAHAAYVAAAEAAHKLRDELDEIDEAVGDSPRFVESPNGGSPTLAERVANMRRELKRVDNELEGCVFVSPEDDTDGKP